MAFVDHPTHAESGIAGDYRLLMCDGCGFGYQFHGDVAKRHADEARHAGTECRRYATVMALQRGGYWCLYIWRDEMPLLREAGLLHVGPDPCAINDDADWAPFWAWRIAAWSGGTRKDKLTLLRRLADDAVARAMIESHPDTLAKLLAAQEQP